jgi:hypothetical protein
VVILALLGYFLVLSWFWAFPRGTFRMVHNQTIALSSSPVVDASANSSLAGNLDGPSAVRSLPNAAMERTSAPSESSKKVLACDKEPK